MPFSDVTLGLTIATTAAALWAVSSMIWGLAGTTFRPVVLNGLKGLFACTLFVVTLLVMGQPVLEPLSTIEPRRLALLAASGIIGISLGDTFYFGCLNRIGPRQASLLHLLSSPMTVLGGWLVLGERIGLLAGSAIGLTVAGVAWVVLEKKRSPRPGREISAGVTGHADTRTGILVGVIFGILAAIGQATGMIMNRSATDGIEASDLWTALWRLGMATLVLLPAMAVLQGNAKQARSPIKLKIWMFVMIGVLLGTYCGIWMQQAAVARAPAGLAQTMLSTTPIWILPMAFFAGERVTWRAVLGSLVAVGGVGLLFYSTA